jgi:hypothetical protein
VLKTIGRHGNRMMNPLDRRVFIGTCSSESEGLQQPMKVGETDKIDCRRAKDIAAQTTGSSIQAARTIATPGSVSTTAISLPDRRSA